MDYSYNSSFSWIGNIKTQVENEFYSEIKTLSFLVYGLGRTGLSVISFFKRNKIRNFKVWDDKNKNFLKDKRPDNLLRALRETNFIILSPGVSLKTSANRNHLIKYKNKIITDIDLIFLQKKFFKKYCNNWN